MESQHDQKGSRTRNSYHRLDELLRFVMVQSCWECETLAGFAVRVKVYRGSVRKLG